MLRGEKVTLRPFEKEDMKLYHELHRNVDLVLMGGSAWEPYPLASFEKEMEKHLGNEHPAEFIIEVDGRIIGDIGLHDHPNRRAGCATLGVEILDPDYVGHGYGRDAINVLLRWAFRIMNYRRIYLFTMSINERAIRCYRACGFVEEGRMRQDDYCNGQYVDTVLMGILREEWEARQAA